MKFIQRKYKPQVKTNKSDWFERNQTKAIIIYSITLIGATWAFSKFILGDREIQIKTAQMETIRQELSNKDTIISQYKAKVEILERENNQLDEKNKKYLTWLLEIPKSIPFYENKIEQLEIESKKSLTLSKETLSKIRERLNSTDFEIINKSFITVDTVYSNIKLQKISDIFFDPLTQVSIGIKEISGIPLTTSGIINLPNKTQVFNNVPPGTKWDFSYKDKQYFIIIESINWYSNEYTIRVEGKK